MNNLLHALSYLIVIRIIVQVMLGLNVRDEDRLPNKGPAIILLNHRSHWDSLILFSLLPQTVLNSVKTFSTTDYFAQNPTVAWFYQTVIGIQPIAETPISTADQQNTNPLQPCFEALSNKQIVILFTDDNLSKQKPLSEFRDNLEELSQAYPQVPIIPVELRGLGNEVPEDRTLFTPSFCDVFIGQPINASGDCDDFNQQLNDSVKQLNDDGIKAGWS